MQVVYYYDEEYTTPDGIVVYRCTVVDKDKPDTPKAIYYPCIETYDKQEVLCTCKHWLYTVEPMLYFNGFYAGVGSIREHCIHLRSVIDILVEEGRL